MPADNSYEAKMRVWLLDALEDGHHEFSDLVCNLPGIDPVALNEFLRSSPDLSERIAWRKQPVLDRCPVGEPIPHPLDFDWRFHASTSMELARELTTLGKRIVLLGAPSVLAAQSLLSSASATLIDINRPESGGSKFTILADLIHGTIPEVESDVVLADPPWYPEATLAFLWAASKFVLPKSKVLLSVAPVGTRPGIDAERSQIMTAASSWGLHLVELRAASLAYSMPPFERNALRAAGLAGHVPCTWRRGDLMVFEKRELGTGVRPIATAPSERWDEVVIDRVRIRIRLDVPPESASPVPRSIVDGDVLPSVSRRHPARSLVRVWTSGNRIFRCENPVRLASLLRGAESREGTNQADRDAINFVNDVVRLERSEYISSGQ